MSDAITKKTLNAKEKQNQFLVLGSLYVFWNIDMPDVMIGYKRFSYLITFFEIFKKLKYVKIYVFEANLNSKLKIWYF